MAAAQAREAMTLGAARLQAAGIASARLDARVLLAKALNILPEAVVTRASVTANELDAFEKVIARRASREPLAYILGCREFWSLSFAVGPGVLIPRPETETLVEEALRDFPEGCEPLHVLDVGTGSGCLLCAFLKERPNATGTGVDTSETALGYARRNAIGHKIAGRTRLFECAWSPSGKDRFTLVFANLPYLTEAEFDSSDPEIREHEPRQALVAGADGLDAMRGIAPVLNHVVARAGRVYLEIGAGQSDKIAHIMRRNGLEIERAVPDLSGITRCLVMGRAGAGGA